MYYILNFLQFVRINFYKGEMLENSFLRNTKYTFLKNKDVTIVKISDIYCRAFVIDNPEMVCWMQEFNPNDFQKESVSLLWL